MTTSQPQSPAVRGFFGVLKPQFKVRLGRDFRSRRYTSCRSNADENRILKVVAPQPVELFRIFNSPKKFIQQIAKSQYEMRIFCAAVNNKKAFEQVKICTAIDKDNIAFSFRF